MDNIKNNTFFSGEITVFLSMLLLLILALVGTSLESARIGVGRSYADRSVQNAMDSLFTEYCNKLWEDYHLFFIEGEKSEEHDKEYIKNQIYYYLKDTFDVKKDKNDILGKMDLLDMEIGQVEVENIVRATDYEGELFLNEILEYSKYQVDEIFLLEGQEAVKSLEEVNSVIKVVEKQMEVEEKMAEVNRELLEFISVIEGISVGKMGIEYKKNGMLKTETYFVKKFCPNGITKTNVGVDNEIVWKSLRSSYIDPVSMLENLEEEAISIYHKLKAQEEQIEELEDFIMIPISYARFYNIKNKLVNNADSVLEKIKKAKKLLIAIKEKQSIFANETIKFEQVYQKEESNLSEPMKESFSKELKELRIFAGLEEDSNQSFLISQILNMESSLNEKENLIKEFLALDNLSIGGSSFEAESCIDRIVSIKNSIEYYNPKEMKFDYSSLVVNKEIENPLESFAKQYKNNLLNLVLENPNIISKKTKKSQVFEGENFREAKEENDYIKNLEKSATKGYTEDVGSDIGIFNRLYDVKKWISDTKNQQFQKLLLTNYIGEHFKSYESSKNESIEKEISEKEEQNKENKEKETLLSYEQEYILLGNLSDKENISEVVTKIVFLRGVLNYIYLLTDLEKTKQAYETATALVGYSCMAPLVQLTKNIILLVWALEEAIVDTTALLQGKEILIFKTKETFCISYEDLLCFDKQLIQTKAKGVPEQTTKIAMNYEQYLQLFLNFITKEEKLHRTMELIEDNIKLRYDEKFQFKNCIYGTKIKVDFYMDKKFISLPFVQKILKTKEENFFIETIQSYCY